MERMHRILIEANLIQAPVRARSASATVPREVLATLLSNIASYGYGVSERVLDALSCADREGVEEWWAQVEGALRAITGDDKNMANFVVYKNFPAEVLSKSEVEYWLPQLLMYWGLPNELFTEPVAAREPLDEELTATILHLAAPASIVSIYEGLLASPVRWTDGQREDVLFLAEQVGQKTELGSVVFKENMVTLGVRLMALGHEVIAHNATDVLRLAAVMSGASADLRERVKFRSFKRAERRALLRMLEASEGLDEDIARRPEVFKRLLFCLHPGDWGRRYGRVVDAHDRLCRGEKFQTYNSRLEAALAARDESALRLLASRPGEFVRRLHVALLRYGVRAAKVFASVVPKLTVTQLVKIEKYLESANQREWRLFAPKGNWTRLQLQLNDLDARRIDSDSLGIVMRAISGELRQRVAGVLPDVYVDPRVDWIKLQTSDSELSPYGRGTVFPIPDNVTFIRTASYWETGETSRNLWFDNGWNFFDKSWSPVGSCCWNVPRYGDAAIFSGDPTNSGEMEGRACQMIDLYLDRMLEVGARYAVWNILCYSRITFAQAKEVYAALQWGEKPQEGKLFEPSRCQLSFPLQGDNYTKYVAYIDAMEREVVYMDANLKANTTSAASNANTVSGVMPGFVEYLEQLPSVADLFKHQPAGEPGVGAQVLWSDDEVVLDGQRAYVFEPRDESSSFEPLSLFDVLSVTGES